MKPQNTGLKIAFGLVIFSFSLALAYYTSNYTDKNDVLGYWPTLASFGGLYVLVGIIVSSVFSVSLGFLFSAVVLIMHILVVKYEDFDDLLKLSLVGFILIVLYAFTWLKMGDKEIIATPSLADKAPLPPPPQQ